MKRKILLISCILPLVVNAAEEPTEPAGWTGEGELGFTSTSGNTESETLTANLGIGKEIDQWKHAAGLKVIQAETDDEESADSLEFTARSEYAFGEKAYVFGKFRHEDDKFSGFEYQNSLAFGIGSRLIDNEQHFLDVSAGLGVRSLKDVETGETEDDGIVTADLIYQYNISESSVFNQRLSIEEGEENTHTESETSLKLKIDGNLSAKIAYLVKRNSDVPDDTEKTDKVTIISLVYGF